MPQNEKIEKFTPFLWALVEREAPSPIFAVAYTGVRRWLHTELPREIRAMNLSDQLKIVGEIVVESYRELPKSPFGHTLGYIFIRKPEEYHEFGVNGRYIGEYKN